MVSGAFPLLSAVNGDTGTTTFAAKAITWQHFKGANTALLLYKNYKLIEMRYVTNLCKGGKALWLFVYRHKPLVGFSAAKRKSYCFCSDFFFLFPFSSYRKNPIGFVHGFSHQHFCH